MPSLSKVSLDVKPGELVLITGASGSGKTTIFRLVNGLAPHFYEECQMTGDVRVEGIVPAEVELYELTPKVGSVFQSPKTQFFCLNTTEELAFSCENLGMPVDEIHRRINSTAEEFGLADNRVVVENSDSEMAMLYTVFWPSSRAADSARFRAVGISLRKGAGRSDLCCFRPAVFRNNQRSGACVKSLNEQVQVQKRAVAPRNRRLPRGQHRKQHIRALGGATRYADSVVNEHGGP